MAFNHAELKISATNVSFNTSAISLAIAQHKS